jgi:putative spermidine/putrescine transport system substrate-binding protein
MKRQADAKWGLPLLLNSVAAAVLLSFSAVIVHAEDSIKVAGYGGATWDAITRDYLVPLKAKTGLDVKLVTEPNLAKLKAMVEAGRCEYEVIELSGSEFDIAKNNGWLQKIDYSIVDPENRMPVETKDPYGFLFVTFSELVAYRADKFPNGGPKNMADFWDVKKYPGPRTLHDSVVPALEFALLADGVKKDDLYKALATDEGVDRAFKKLDEIKPSVVKFWGAGAEPIQMLANGEVAVAIAWNGRIKKLQDDGTHVVMVWQDANTDSSHYGIPKGCANGKGAATYLNAWTNPEWATNWTKDIPYPGFVPGVTDKLDPALAKNLPTYPDNVKAAFFTDWAFWVKNREKLEARWKEWLLK